MSTELVRGLREAADYLAANPASPLAVARGAELPDFFLHLSSDEWTAAVDALGTFTLRSRSSDYIRATRELAGGVLMGYQAHGPAVADILLTCQACEGGGKVTDCPSNDPQEAEDYDCADCSGQGMLTTAAMAELHAERRPPEPEFDLEDIPF